MKHSISILFTLLLLVVGTNTFAQKGFSWDTYKIGVTMADDTKVVENADNMFKSDNEDMTYNMFIFDKGYASSEDLVGAAKVLSADFGFQYKEELKDVTGLTFSGKYLFGTSGNDRILLAGLTDTDGTNLFVYVVLKKEDKVEAALNAINSLSK
jgi:hypothetical protein